MVLIQPALQQELKPTTNAMPKIVEEGRLVPDPERIKALKINHLVENANDLRGVLGVLRYFQNMTPNLATRLASYHEKLKTGHFHGQTRSR